MAIPVLSDLPGYVGKKLNNSDWTLLRAQIINFLTDDYDVTYNTVHANYFYGDVSNATGFPTFNITELTAGEALTAGQAVRLASGQVFKATSASAVGITNVIGIVTADAALNAAATVTRFLYSTTGLTANSTYYVGTTGTITTTKPSTNAKPIGFALSTTTLLLAPCTEENQTFSSLNVTGNVGIGTDSPNTTLDVRGVTEIQTDTSDLLSLYRPINTSSSIFGMDFYARDSASAKAMYAAIYGQIVTNTAGATEGQLVFQTKSAGGLSTKMRINQSGDIFFFNSATKIIPGATSLLFRNNADNATNLSIADNGAMVARAGLTGLTALGLNGDFTLSTAITNIIGGITSILFKNNANNATNLQILDAGTATFRDSLTITGQPRARVYKTSNQTINNTTSTAITFEAETFDVGGCHNNVTANSHLTCVVAGPHYVEANVKFQPDATGVRLVTIQKNGVTVCQSSTNAVANGLDTDISISTLVDMAVNDYVEVYAYQDSGVSLLVSSGGNSDVGTHFSFIKEA